MGLVRSAKYGVQSQLTGGGAVLKGEERVHGSFGMIVVGVDREGRAKGKIGASDGMSVVELGFWWIVVRVQVVVNWADSAI